VGETARVNEFKKFVPQPLTAFHCSTPVPLPFRITAYEPFKVAPIRQLAVGQRSQVLLYSLEGASSTTS